MELQDYEIRYTWYAIKATLIQLEAELKKKETHPGTDYEKANKEFEILKVFFKKISIEKEKYEDVFPFTHFPSVFFPK